MAMCIFFYFGQIIYFPLKISNNQNHRLNFHINLSREVCLMNGKNFKDLSYQKYRYYTLEFMLIIKCNGNYFPVPANSIISVVMLFQQLVLMGYLHNRCQLIFQYYIYLRTQIPGSYQSTLQSSQNQVHTHTSGPARLEIKFLSRCNSSCKQIDSLLQCSEISHARMNLNSP